MSKLLLFSICIVLFVVTNVSAQLNSPPRIRIPRIKTLGMFDDEDTTKAKFYWFPAHNADQAARIWTQGGRWNFLNMAAISGTASGGSASVDIVSDYLGPVRFSLMGNIASSKEDSIISQNVEKFFSGGGNAVLIANLIAPTLTWGENSYMMTNIVPKLGFDFPALGSSSTSTTYNLDLGAEFRISIPFSNNNLGILGNIREGYTIGGEDFYKQMELKNESPFLYTSLNVGITLPNLNMAILFSKIIDGPEIINLYNGEGRISLVITPKAK